MPADPQGKEQHVVEPLNLVESGTSILLDAQVREDFTAEVAKARLGQPVADLRPTCQHHLRSRYPLGRQSRGAVIFPPRWCASVPAWASQSRSVRRGILKRMPSWNAITAPISRNA